MSGNHLIKVNFFYSVELGSKRLCMFFPAEILVIVQVLMTWMVDPDVICITVSFFINVRLHCPCGPYAGPFDC